MLVEVEVVAKALGARVLVGPVEEEVGVIAVMVRMGPQIRVVEEVVVPEQETPMVDQVGAGSLFSLSRSPLPVG